MDVAGRLDQLEERIATLENETIDDHASRTARNAERQRAAIQRAEPVKGQQRALLPWNLQRGCSKRRYPCRRNARAKAAAVERRRGDRMNAYRCSACGAWHVGHLKY